MEIETPAATLSGDELRRLLAATLSPDKASVDAAAAGLDRAAADPRSPLAILAVAAGIPMLPPATSCNCTCALTLRFCESLHLLLPYVEFNLGGATARNLCAQCCSLVAL